MLVRHPSCRFAGRVNIRTVGGDLANPLAGLLARKGRCRRIVRALDDRDEQPDVVDGRRDWLLDPPPDVSLMTLGEFSASAIIAADGVTCSLKLFVDMRSASCRCRTSPSERRPLTRRCLPRVGGHRDQK